ncbi:MAG: DUF4364 family protein [Clostridia bacterium]|nr:DUF4364 family protein [Clostridia bacterium]
MKYDSFGGREETVVEEMEYRNQAKVFILYVMNGIQEPQEFTAINEMVLQDEFVNYFDFATAFNDLLEKKQIEEVPAADGSEPLYRVTPLGLSILESYESDLSAEMRDKALRHAMRVLLFRRDGVSQKSDIREVPGGCILHCEIADQERVLFSTEVFVNDPSYAARLRTNFDDHADVIYKGTMSLLSGDVNYIFDE